MPHHDPKLSYYSYDPNVAANVLFAVLYTIVGVVSIVQYFYYKSWFWWPVILANLMTMVGYIDRVLSVKDVLNRNEYIIQFCMIVLAPAIIAAGFYMAYARIIYWVTPEQYRVFKHMWVPARWLTPTFVTFDVVSFLIQLLGASILAAAEPWETDKLNRGKNIIRIGLIVQLVCFGFFTFVGARFLLLCRRFRNTWPKDTNWLRLMYAINVGCLMILIRSIFRMIEYSMGLHAYPSVNEWPFLVFDSSLILIALGMFNLFHPGMYLPNLGLRKRRIYTGRRNADDVDLCQFDNATSGPSSHDSRGQLKKPSEQRA